MELDNSCHPDLSDYAGVWIDKDPRSEGYRLGCGYAFQDDDCQGTFNPFELNFSGQSRDYHFNCFTDLFPGSEHTTVSFDDVKIGYVGKSFQFSDVSYFLDHSLIAITDDRHLVREEG